MPKKFAILVALLAVGVIAVLILTRRQPSEILEVRAKVLPGGHMGLAGIRDLDGDGNEELVVNVDTPSWFGSIKSRTFIVTMRRGRLVVYPTPFAEAKVSSTGGRKFIGITRSKETAVGERLPNGEWKVEVLMSTPTPFWSYALGDWDGDGEDNEALLSADGSVRVFRCSNGRWRQVEELKVSGTAMPCFINETKWGVEVNHYHDLPLFFWRGRWHVGQKEEEVYLFTADWDGDGRTDKLLARIAPNSKTLTLDLMLKSGDERSRFAFQQLQFADWLVASVTATEKLENGRWCLLVLLARFKPPALRLMDFHFVPSKGWQGTELAKWRVPIAGSIEALVTDNDGNGQVEIFVVETKVGVVGKPPPHRCFWLLQKTPSGWQPRALRLPPLELWRVQLGERLWFIGYLWDGRFGLGTFRSDGQWQPIWQGQRASRHKWPELVDLNDDGVPEGLVVYGDFFYQPAFLWRTKEGKWQERRLYGATLTRWLSCWLRHPDVGVDPRRCFVVRWEGKKWLVILWDDGYVQAVTLR